MKFSFKILSVVVVAVAALAGAAPARDAGAEASARARAALALAEAEMSMPPVRAESLNYADATAKALAAKKSLVVWVSVENYPAEDALANMVHCHVFSMQGVKAPSIIVGRYVGGQLHRFDLPASASESAIRAAGQVAPVAAPPVASPEFWQPQQFQFPQFQPSQNCPNGRCPNQRTR
jgi:hypothetical protein